MKITTKITTVSALGLSVLGAGLMATPASAQTVEANTSDRPAFVEQGERQKGAGKRRFRRNFADDVTKTVTKIDNGIILTLTTDDADLLAKLQEREGKKEKENVTTVKVNIDNGVQLTITSDDREIVAKMHERADKKAMKENITKNVENLDNGVKITVTGSTAEAITAIQEREEKLGKNNEEITRTRTEISNGVELTLTSDNADIVTRIQKRAERGGKGKRGGKRGHRGQGPNTDQ